MIARFFYARTIPACLLCATAHYFLRRRVQSLLWGRAGDSRAKIAESRTLLQAVATARRDHLDSLFQRPGRRLGEIKPGNVLARSLDYAAGRSRSGKVQAEKREMRSHDLHFSRTEMVPHAGGKTHRREHRRLHAG